jgi:hypothetical protein
MPETPMLSRPNPSTSELMPVIGLGTWAVFDVNAGAGVEGCSDRMREPTMVKVRLDTGKSARLPQRPSRPAAFDRLLRARCAIYHC